MRTENLYWVTVGIGLLVVGGVEVAVGILGVSRTAGPVVIGGTYVLWRGVILSTAGGLYVHAVLADVALVRERAIVVLASGMLWITAATQLLSTLLGAIPGGEGVWVAPPGAVLGALAPPYAPVLIAVVFTLPAVRHLDGITAVERLQKVVAS